MFRRPAAVATLARGYVPILLVKRGEREALEHLDEETWRGLTPLLRVVPPELRSRSDDAPPEAEMMRLSRIIGDRAIYLDTAGTPRRKRKIRPLDRTYVHKHLEAAVAAGLALAPVLPFGRHDLAPVIAEFSDDLGAAISLSPEDALTWSQENFETAVRRQVDILGVDESRLDLLIDFGYVADGLDDPASASWLVSQAVEAARWRSVILAATSVPDSLSEEIPEDSVNAIERREIGLFRSVQHHTRARLRFGDYGVQHPVPPAGGAAPKMRASIRYTSGPHMFVSRGGQPVGEMNRDQLPGHYQELAARLREHRAFTDKECCWGDKYIAELADGRVVVRSQYHMRAVATCHHLTVVTRERQPAKARSVIEEVTPAHNRSRSRRVVPR